MSSVISVSPFRCRMWALHDRHDANITEKTCREMIESFLAHGQLMPVLGRQLTRRETEHDVELIYGARRLFVAQHINVPIKVELRALSDRDAAVAMDIENRQRADISPYERGMSYLRWLRAGHFQSQDDIARALRVSASQVSRLLKLARLPAVIVDAFGSPLHICEGWGLSLMELLDDAQKRQATLGEARLIAMRHPRPAAREVFARLLAASTPGRKAKSKARDEVVRDGTGGTLFRIRHQVDTVALLLPRTRVSADLLNKAREAVAAILEDASTNP
jgi:ParB family transcriptional regulator, chromosome partitioning protein